MAGAFVAILNDVTFDPSTGVQAALPQLLNGPLTQVAASII